MRESRPTVCHPFLLLTRQLFCLQFFTSLVYGVMIVHSPSHLLVFFFIYSFRVQVVVNLSFQQAARGVNKDVNVNVVDTCPKCQGSRCEPGTKAVRCPNCNGTGMETVSTGEAKAFGVLNQLTATNCFLCFLSS